MNPVQIHLALNHVPIILSITGGLIFAYALITKNSGIQKTGLILLIISAITMIPVYLTGDSTEDIVENLPLISESSIKTHEESAELTMIIMMITGSLAIVTLIAIIKRFSFSRVLSIFTVALATFSFVASANTAHLGGLIRHQEIKSFLNSKSNDKLQPANEKQETGKESKEENEKDKDND
jgi:uncharacterized membrane protein